MIIFAHNRNNNINKNNNRNKNKMCVNEDFINVCKKNEGSKSVSAGISFEGKYSN